MAAHIAYMIKRGNKQGYPIPKPADVIPGSDDVYVLNPLRQSNPDSTHAHQSLPFLRANPVNATVIVMKNKDLRPVMVKARDMPSGIAFNNIVEVLLNFHATYCDKEGLSRTSVLAWEVLLFLFYGTWASKKKFVTRPSCLYSPILRP